MSSWVSCSGETHSKLAFFLFQKVNWRHQWKNRTRFRLFCWTRPNHFWTSCPILKEHLGFEKLVFSVLTFGGEQTPESDLDILVEIQNPKMSLLDFLRLENAISELIGIPVDLVDQTILKPALEGRILDEVVYI